MFRSDYISSQAGKMNGQPYYKHIADAEYYCQIDSFLQPSGNPMAASSTIGYCWSNILKSETMAFWASIALDQ